VGTGGGWPRRVDKRGRRHRLAGGGLLLIRLDVVTAPHPGWVCVLGGGLRRPLLCLRFLSLIFYSGTVYRRSHNRPGEVLQSAHFWPLRTEHKC